jgi:hypothetical protein
VRAWLPVALALATVALGGCGLGAGKGTSDVTLTVTRSFGASAIGSVTDAKVPGSETVMRMLERSFRVQTRYGGGFVESINGNSGSASRLDWFYYVNGIEAPKGAAGTPVHRGDRIWWDLHDWSATDDVPAVVGSFPEPFIHGSGGKRYPTAIECASDVSVACGTVSNALSAQGVPVANQGLGTGSGQATIAVVVGTWSELQGLIAARLIQHGPGSSGVYARFSHGALQLLDPHGSVARTLGSDAGLIAATADQSSAPTWLITGTDPAGVAAAAKALTARRLHDHFALAVQGQTDIPLPVNGPA